MVIVFYCAVLIFTSLLFFFRTRAVFGGNPWVTAFFAGLWLAVLGGCLALIIDVFEPMNSESNTMAICLDPGFNPFVAAVTIIPLVNDTLAFLAMSWRLSRNSYYEPYTLIMGIRFLIFGDYLPVFSRALLRDGQAYYLLALSDLCLMLKQLTGCSFHRTIVTMNIISVIMLFYPSNPDILRTIFVVPNMTLMNVMAGRAFRNAMLFETSGGTEISTIQFREIWQGESRP